MSKLKDPDYCGMHGKKPYWVKTKIAKGEICVECVAAGYYRKDIEEEIKENYPDAYASAKAGTIDQYKGLRFRQT